MNKNKLDELERKLKGEKWKKNKVKDIAEQEKDITEANLKKIYIAKFFEDIYQNIALNEITENILSDVSSKLMGDLEHKFKFVQSDLKKIILKSLYVAFKNGFLLNMNNINAGIMIANAGDSAEFIFVARAILAGFNCSSVDVRSSRYDAIIDYNNRLLRVQIKGISDGNVISFVDRDRGGQGIDHKHERNRGKRIDSTDCDIYVAVDKQVGICYIIPMQWADALSDDKAKRVKLSDIEKYRENWDIIVQETQRPLTK